MGLLDPPVRVTKFNAATLSAVPIAIGPTPMSDATFPRTTVGTSRTPYRVLTDATNIRLVYNNWTGTSSGDSTPSTDTVIGGAAIEYAGVITKATFKGQYDVTIKPGGIAISDPLAVDVVAGQLLNVRTYMPSGTWYGNRYAYRSSEAVGGFTTTTDLTATGSATIADSTATWLAGPAQIVGTPIATSGFTNAVSKKIVAFIGDSITHGVGDGYPGGYTGWNISNLKLGRGGWVDRGAVALGYLPTRIGITGYQLTSAINSPYTRRFSYSFIGTAPNTFSNFGINDVLNGRTLPQIQADLIALWTMQASQGKRVFQTTITPQTSSTDFWQTTTNQSIPNSGRETVRVGLNDWLRDGAPIVSGAAAAVGTSGAVRARYLVGNTVTGQSSDAHPLYASVEFADTVESARNSGKWKAASYSRTVNDAITTAAGGSFTSATANFTSADLGRQTAIAGAGTAGALLGTAISAFSSSSAAALLNVSPTAVTAAAAAIFEAFTMDGLHPSATAHELLAAAVPSTHFI